MPSGNKKIDEIEENIFECQNIIEESVFRFSIFSCKRNYIFKHGKSDNQLKGIVFDANEIYNFGIVRLMTLLGSGDRPNTKSMRNLLNRVLKIEDSTLSVKSRGEELNRLIDEWLGPDKKRRKEKRGEAEGEASPLKTYRDKYIVHMESLGFDLESRLELYEDWPIFQEEISLLLSHCMHFYKFMDLVSGELNLGIDFPFLTEVFERGVTMAYAALHNGEMPSPELVHSVILESPVIGEPHRYMKSSEESLDY